MRRCLYALAALATVLISMAGCGGGEDPVSPGDAARLIDTTLVIGAKGGELRTSIKPRSSWKATLSSSGQWCSFNPGSGGSGGATIVIKVEANSDLATRTARIDITSKSGNGTITILQKQMDVLDVTVDDSCRFGPEGGSFTAKLEYNVDYSIECGADWVRNLSTKALQSASATFQVDKNATGEKRSCAVTFFGADISHTVTVSQESAEISAEPQNLLIDAAGGSVLSTISSNVSYSIGTPDAQWAAVASGTDAGEDGVPTAIPVSVTVEENPDFFNRECSVPLGNPIYNVSDTLRITQKGIDILSYSFVPFEYGPGGGEFSFDLPSDKSYTLSGSDFIEIVTYSDMPLRRTLRVGRNTGPQHRAGSVTVSSGNKKNTLEFAQLAASISPDRPQIKFATEGGRDTLKVSANVSYNLVRPQDAPWCTIDSLPGGMYLISAAANAGEQARSCTLGFSDSEFGALSCVEIIQAQKNAFTVSPDSFDFSPEGGEAKVTVHSNVEYSCSSQGAQGWIAESGRSGECHTYTVALNATGASRRGILTFCSDSETLSVTIFQSEAYIRAAQHRLTPGPEACSGTLEVESNISCEVSSSADWLSASLSSGKISWSATAYSGWDLRIGRIIISNPRYCAADTINVLQGIPSQFDISAKEFILGPAQGEFEVSVQSNMDYTYSISDSWISDLGGGKFSVERNSGGEDRSGSIIYSAGGKNFTVSVIQSAARVVFDPCGDISFPAEGGTRLIAAESTIPLSVSCEGGDWLSCTTADGISYAIAAEASALESPRSGNVTFFNGDFGYSFSFPVIQAQKDVFSFSPAEFRLGPESKTFEVSVHSNVSYTCTTSDNWIFNYGGGKFSVSGYTGTVGRSGSIIYTAAGREYSIPVSQEGPRLALSQTVFELDSLGGGISIDVDSNIEYTVSMPQCDWIAAGGASDGSLTFNVAENTTARPRSCSVIVCASSFNLADTVHISQSGIVDRCPFVLEQSEFAAGPDLDTITVAHSKCDEVGVSITNGSWIKPIEELSTSTSKVFVCSPNVSGLNRTATVTLLGYEKAVSATVTQSIPSLQMSVSDKKVAAAGETYTAEVTANFRYTLSCSEDWVMAEPGADYGSISFCVAENTTGEMRKCTVTIANSRVNFSRAFTLTQLANSYVHITPESVDAPSDGGEYSVSVATNIIDRCTALSLCDWLSVTGQDDSYLVTVSANTSTSARSGNVYFSCGDMQATFTVSQAGYRNPDYYYSSDFSQDGTSVSLQKAGKGAGIPLILMGDAFSDRLIADGTYAAAMEKTVEAVFAVEPFKSLRDLFDISYINVVSLNEIYADDATTALGTSFSSGTVVTGNHSAVRSRALSLIGQSDLERAMLVVIMNQATYAGTTYLYNYLSTDADYAPGEAIAYIPLCRDDAEFAAVVQHEACGHGLGKLADEYFYSSYGEITAEKMAEYKQWQQSGFYRNVDFTPDETNVLWSKFIGDERYQSDGIGVYEGACGYPSGAYRPTDYSKMRLNSYQFNAPSREAIYYRLHKLAYGSDWSYDFEAFAAYDAINRRSSPAASQASQSRARRSAADAVLLPPPVMLYRTE